MKVFLAHTEGGHAIARVVRALSAHAPASVSIVDRENAADLVILHVVGRLQHTLARARVAQRRGQAYAIAQYVLQSSLNKQVEEWFDLWSGAVFVWSYYDLRQMAQQSGAIFPSVPFLHAPLGVDFARLRGEVKVWDLATSGVGWLQESVRECHRAAQSVNQKAWHLGPPVRRHVNAISGVSDDDLSLLLASTRYVSGLRRHDGFELPAAEGLACRARPILFDRPHYRQWYGDWAEYIPEAPREDVEAAVARILTGPYRPVTVLEASSARAFFSWRRIAPQFWKMAA